MVTWEWFIPPACRATKHAYLRTITNREDAPCTTFLCGGHQHGVWNETVAYLFSIECIGQLVLRGKKVLVPSASAQQRPRGKSSCASHGGSRSTPLWDSSPTLLPTPKPLPQVSLRIKHGPASDAGFEIVVNFVACEPKTKTSLCTDRSAGGWRFPLIAAAHSEPHGSGSFFFL